MGLLIDWDTKEERNMTLLELSAEYRAHAQALEERIRLLEGQLAATEGYTQRDELIQRIQMLATMLGEARELAALTEHYYQKNFRRNPYYSL